MLFRSIAGVQTYPNQDAPYAVPANLTWDREAGYARLGDKPYIYDPSSGWLMDPATMAYHDANYGYRYDAAGQCLVDDATGAKYDMSYNPLS